MSTTPTQADVKRAILDAVASYNIRAGEVVPVMGLNVKAQQQGFRAAEIECALQAMFAEGLFEESNAPTFIKITTAGFAAI